MVISKTPLRMSFAGGGSDLPAFSDRHGGAVLSTAIDKWIRVGVAVRFEGDVRVSYSQTEIVGKAGDLQHELVREAMNRTGLVRGVEVITLADLPSQGTGLGSSSAVTVGLLAALYGYEGVQKSPEELAMEACRIEIDVLGKPIGKQDQYAAALGGMNLIEFKPDGSVISEPVVAPPEHFAALHRSLLLFYTGVPRQSGDEILERQGTAVEEGDDKALLELRDLAYEMRGAFSSAARSRRSEICCIEAGSSSKPRPQERRPTRSMTSTSGRVKRVRGAASCSGPAEADSSSSARAPEAHQAVRKALSEYREIPFRFADRGAHLLLVEHT